MSKPDVHARNSARKFGGVPDDYVAIHQFFDSSKGTVSDNRHRLAFHHALTLQPDGVLERIFGREITNQEGKRVNVRDIGEQHLLEDFGGSIPTLQDYAMAMTLEPWMNGFGFPPSAIGLPPTTRSRPQTMDEVLAEVVAWGDTTFPDSKPDGIIKHLEEELVELRDEPASGEEMADVVMLVAHLAMRQGIDLKKVIQNKLAKNRQRTWEKVSTTGYYRHKELVDGD